VACLEWAGGRTGPGYAAQGNIVVSGATVDALAETFEATSGRLLAERILERLAAAQDAGGELAVDLETRAGLENLETRVRGAERFDPLVLAELRRASS